MIDCEYRCVENSTYSSLLVRETTTVVILLSVVRPENLSCSAVAHW